jgi:hypothetical protein
VSSYDEWKQTAPEESGDPPPPCKVCTGEGDDTCGEECSELAERCDRERKIRGHYLDAWQALRLAREYREGDATSDFRIRAIVRRVYLIRVGIAELRRAA